METIKAMKAVRPLRIKKISIDFKFDNQYVTKHNPRVVHEVADMFQKLQVVCSSGRISRNPNCLFLFGTWDVADEIIIGKYNLAFTTITFKNVWNEKTGCWKDKAAQANKILKEDPDRFIHDFVIGTIKMIDEIKNDRWLEKAKYKVSFRIAYTGTEARDYDGTCVVYDSTTGFIY